VSDTRSDTRSLTHSVTHSVIHSLCTVLFIHFSLLYKVAIVNFSNKRFIITLKLECTKFDFGRSSSPDPAWGAYSAPPCPLAGFQGPTPTGKGKRRGGKGDGRMGRSLPSNVSSVANVFKKKVKTELFDQYLQQRC